MADLDALIRLRRHRVEEKQKVLADLFRQAEVIEAEKKDLLDTLAREREIAETVDHKDASVYFGLYSDGVHKKIEGLDKELLQMETRIQIVQDDIREAFADLKRVEIVNNNRKAEERKKQAAKESNTLDEMGIDAYRRQQGEE